MCFRHKMSYSNAVKGRLTRSSMKGYILSQAELELCRSLNQEEEAMLFEMFSTQDIFNRIHKVCINYFIYFCIIEGFFLVWLWNYQVFVASV